MTKMLMSAFLLLIMGAIVLVLMTQFNESQIRKNDSRAYLIMAQGQNRLDTAQAFSVIMLTGLPYIVIVVVSGFSVCLMYFMWSKRPEKLNEKNVERIEVIHYVVLPVMGQSPREIYKKLPERIQEIRR